MGTEARSGGGAAGFARGALWGIAALAALPLLGVLAAGFVNWDDRWLIVENPWLGRLDGAAWRAVWDPFGDRHAFGNEYLPLRDTSWLIDAAVWGKEPLGFHLGNLVLHAVCVVLAAVVLRGMGLTAAAALAGAALFAVHPVHVEAVAWATSRKDVLSAAFYLGAVALFLRLRRAPAAWRAAGVVGLSAAAILSKYPAVTLPAMLLLIDLVCTREGGGRRFLLYLPLGALAAGALWIAVRVASGFQDSVLTTQDLMPTWQSRAATMLAVHLRYLGLLLWPAGLAPIHEVAVLRGLGAPIALAGAAAVAGLLGLAAWAWRRAPRVAALVGWHFVALLPVLGLMPLRILMAERYLYVASLGACGLAGMALMRWPRAGRVATVALVLAGAVVSFQQQAIWHDDASFWPAAAAAAPRNPTALRGLADVQAQRGALEAAFGTLERLAEVTPAGFEPSPARLRAWAAHARELLAAGDPAAAQAAVFAAIAGRGAERMARDCGGAARAQEWAARCLERATALRRLDAP